VTSRSGVVEVVGEDRADVEVSGRADCVLEGEGADAVLVVNGGSDRTTVRCPRGCDVVIGSLSGRVDVSGRLGDVRVTTASGSIAVAAAATVDARTTSGRVSIGQCDDLASVQGTSSSVEVGDAGRVEVTTKSGTVVAERVRGAHVRSVSGRVELGLGEPVAVEVSTVSGRVEITVPPGLRPAIRLDTRSGKVRSEVETGADGTLAVTTTSGAIRLRSG
jgi:DUF4097 and DUF4098 domain-containing protein YvlB